MNVWKGNTENETIEYFRPLRSIVQYYIITNMSSSVITVNMKIRMGGEYVQICPLDLQLAAGDSLTGDVLLIEANEAIVLQTSGGTVDYYFLMNA